ncbi:hypothetical protein BH11PSE8_BH11PSE8_35550 [soil metagenome]
MVPPSSTIALNLALGTAAGMPSGEGMARRALQLPSLSQSGADGLSPTQRRVMVLGIVAAHVVGVYAILQVREVHQAAVEAVPMFVNLIAPAPPVPPTAPPPPPKPQPIQKKPQPARVVAAAPSPAPSTIDVQAPLPDSAPEPTPPAPVEVVAVPAPPAPAPEPSVIPASSVRYLEPLMPVYPRLSVRLQETGRVMVRVFIDEHGMPQQAQVSKTSGFARLDESALAAVRKVRFEPYTSNGRPATGWAFIPVDFVLEK